MTYYSYEEYIGSDNEVDPARLCDNCITAFGDAGIPVNNETVWLGAEIDDHTCELQRCDEGLPTSCRVHRCDCGCRA